MIHLLAEPVGSCLQGFFIYILRSIFVFLFFSQEIDRHEIDDEVFFNFVPERSIRRKFEKPGYLPGIQEEEKPLPRVPQEARDEIEGPP